MPPQPAHQLPNMETCPRTVKITLGLLDSPWSLLRRLDDVHTDRPRDQAPPGEMPDVLENFIAGDEPPDSALRTMSIQEGKTNSPKR